MDTALTPAVPAPPTTTGAGDLLHLVEPAVLYGPTSAALANPLVAQRLHQQLLDELRRAIGVVTADLDVATRRALATLTWQPGSQQTIAQLAAAALAALASDQRIASEAAAVRARVLASPTQTIDGRLGLGLPVIDNPVLHSIVSQALAVAFAGLAGLSADGTRLLVLHSDALQGSGATTLDALLGQGAITAAQHATLATILELAKLTHENLALIRTLVGQGVTSPLQLVPWTGEQWQQLIVAQEIAVPPGQTPAIYVEAIVANLEAAYPAHALSSHAGERHVATLLARNPTLDLRSADLSRATEHLDWSGIPTADRAAVHQELRSYQRLVALADSPADQLALKRAGYDSALTIAGMPEEAFVRSAGIDEGRARLTYARAHDAAAMVAHHYAGAHHLLKRGFSELPVGNTAPLADALRQVEGMNELFGSADYCDCDDCHSVLSPGAYFVDLMHFIETHVSKPVFEVAHQLDHPLQLRRRRPDLWTLELNEANTTTLVPYLTIVNEVLEAYLRHRDGAHPGPDIYATLADPELKISFRVPFSLPFAELKLYLGYFDLSPAEIYRLAGAPASQVHRAQLGLAPSETTVIITPDPGGVTARLGPPGHGGDYALGDVLRITGLTRDELDALLASRYHPDLAAVTVISEPLPGELQNFPQGIANLTGARLDFLHRLVRLWRATPWKPTELDLIMTAGAGAGLIGRDLDDRVIELLARLSGLQRRARLDAIELCALIDQLPSSRGLPAQFASAHPHLYEQVFAEVLGVHGASKAGAEPPAAQAPGKPGELPFHHHAFNTTDATDTTASPEAAQIAAAIGVSDADLVLLLSLLAAELGFDSRGDCTLDQHKLSLLYRHARIAGGLRFSVAELTQALALLFDRTEQTLSTLDQIECLAAFAEWLRHAPFTLAEVRFIVQGTADPPMAFTTTTATVTPLVQQAAASRDPRGALRSATAAMFNLSAARMTDLLAWTASDLDGPGVQTALATKFAADGTPSAPAELVPLTDLCGQLERASLLFGKLKLDDANLGFITHQPAALGIANPKAVTLADVQAITRYASLIKPVPELPPGLDPPTEIQAALSALAAGTPLAEGRLAQVWGVNAHLLSSLPRVLPRAGNALATLAQLREAASLCHRVGIGAHSLQTLSGDGSSDELARARDVARGAVTAKLADAAKRKEVLEPLEDRINVLRRDALCDYIIARHAELGFTSHADLYDFFLLDADMGACFRTSRVVCAISSLQVYVERCLQGLEQTRPQAHVAHINVPPGAAPTGGISPGGAPAGVIPAEQWEWRKNFRVWQANRMVFLYPESYTDPDLLDIKTPLLEELEDDLLSQNITMESATEAYRSYLTTFADLAHLHVAGSCYDEHEHTYYLLGRTHQDPPTYYWRSWDGVTWSPWKQVDAAIEALTVSPIKYAGRLYVFWVDTKSKEKSSISGGNSTLEYCEVTIALKYTMMKPNGKWLAPQKLDALRPRLVPPSKQDRDRWHVEEMISTIAAAIGAQVSAVHDPDPQPPPGLAWNNRLLGPHADSALAQMEKVKTYRRVYPIVHGDSLILRYFNDVLHPPSLTERELDVFHNKLRDSTARFGALPAEPAVLLFPSGRSVRLGLATQTYLHEPGFDLALEQLLQPGRHHTPPHTFLTDAFPYHPPGDDELDFDYVLNLVHNSYPESILMVGGQQFLIYDTPKRATRAVHLSAPPPPPGHATSAHPPPGHAHAAAYNAGPVHGGAPAATMHRATAHRQATLASHQTSISRRAQTAIHMQAAQRQLVRLSTSTADDLGEVFVRHGIDSLFALSTQRLHETPIGVTIRARAELHPPHDEPAHLNFTGAMGMYYRELFFHIPWLIARSLRTNGRYEEALTWYRRIFDPTASGGDDHAHPADRVWRYVEFRGQTVPKLQAILTNPAAIAAYENDPFNPHAIARLRPSAYQRAIVMDMIGCIIDWADSLFSRYTMESVVEAGIWYNLAAEMLGRRPARLGKCHTVADRDLTYERLASAEVQGSEFLLMLENWALANHGMAHLAKAGYAVALHGASHPIEPHLTPATAAGTAHAPAAPAPPAHAANGHSAPVKLAVSSPLLHHATVAQRHNEMVDLERAVRLGMIAPPSRHAPATDVLRGTMAFCVPPNKALLGIYDLIEDRQFKIRNCLNIAGVRQELALFAPPIDPMALVRARAAGLSLDEALSALQAPVPPYRFTHLIERARQFAQTVQSFGSALLAALEKKDAEELTRLRSVHERHVLRMTSRAKSARVTETQHELQAIVEQKANVQNRIDYYNGLVNDGLNTWETTEQITKHAATILRTGEVIGYLVASIGSAVPDVGSPFAMKYGGTQIGHVASNIANWTKALADILDAVSASAALEAGWQRRKQEWSQQLLLVQQEFKQVEQQRLAAEIRADIAQRELDIHELTIDQADELDQFYKDKFTGLGLYNYLATKLTRLHHDAYNTADALARMAQSAYAFERDDDTQFIALDNWQPEHNGLLAGDRLLLQLDQMEAAHLRTNTRQLEMTQSFSLALIDPRALLTLRETGSCQFTLPEIVFDIAYPGQFKRIIDAVQITIPSVVGPHTSVSAKLTLTDSKVRKRATVDPGDLMVMPAPPTSSIATSTGSGDSGVHEFSFRDERYRPFEGAGAISTWKLDLPHQLRSFDYGTIPDVIIRLSYRALDDDGLRTTVENAIVDQVIAYATDPGLPRVFSLRHEFPDAYYQLLHPTAGDQSTTVKIGQEHFPYFLAGRALTITGATLSLKPKASDQLDTSGLVVSLNETAASSWITPPNTLLSVAEIPVRAPALADWKIKISAGRLDPATVGDIFLLIKYTVG